MFALRHQHDGRTIWTARDGTEHDTTPEITPPDGVALLTFDTEDELRASSQAQALVALGRAPQAIPV